MWKSRGKSTAFALLLWVVGSCLVMGQGQEGDSEDPLAVVRARGVIEIAVYDDFPPYSSRGTDREAQGIDVDLARALAQHLELKLKLRLIAAGDSVSDDLRNHVWKGHYLGGGVADLMLHVGYDAAFAQHEGNVQLFAPYFHESVAIAYKPSRIPHLESPLALTEHKIAVEGDTISDYILSSGYGGALRTSAVRKLSLEEAVVAFKAEEVDAVMGPKAQLQGLLAEQGVRDVSFHTQEPVGLMRTGWNLGLAVKKSANTDLRDAIARIIAGMEADGSLAKVFADRGVTYVEPPASGDK